MARDWLNSLTGGKPTHSDDDLWKAMEEAGWNAQAAVDKLNPYATTSRVVENNRTGGYRTVKSSNKYAREQQVSGLQKRYEDTKHADRTRMGAVLRLGSADPGAEQLHPGSEADVVAPTADTTGRQDFGASADSGRAPAEGASGTGAGLNVDKTKRRRSGINI